MSLFKKVLQQVKGKSSSKPSENESSLKKSSMDLQTENQNHKNNDLDCSDNSLRTQPDKYRILNRSEDNFSKEKVGDESQSAGDTPQLSINEKAQSRYEKKLLRRQIRQDFYALLEMKAACEDKDIIDFYLKYLDVPELLDQSLSQYKHSNHQQANLFFSLLTEKPDLEHAELLIRRERIAALKKDIDVCLPELIRVPISPTEEGPNLEVITYDYLKEIVSTYISKSELIIHGTDSNLPLPSLGQHSFEIDFGEDLIVERTILVELNQAPLPDQYASILDQIQPLNLPENEDPILVMQAHLDKSSPLDFFNYYPRKSAVLSTAFKLGYWKTPWIQELFHGWKDELEDYLAGSQFEKANDSIADVFDQFDKNDPGVKKALKIFDLQMGKYQGASRTDSGVVWSSAVRELLNAINHVRSDVLVYRSNSKLNNIPRNLTDLQKNNKQIRKLDAQQQTEILLHCAKYYAGRGQIELLTLSSTHYCILKAKSLWAQKKRRDARLYLIAYFYLYGQLTQFNAPMARQLQTDFYTALGLFYGTYNLKIYLKSTSTNISEVFETRLQKYYLSVDNRKRLVVVGRPLVEIGVANPPFIYDLINRYKNRQEADSKIGNDARKMLLGISKSLQEPGVFRLEPWMCLQLLARIDPDGITQALSNLDIGRRSISAEDRRIAAIAIIRFAHANSNLNLSDFPILGSSLKVSPRWRTTMAFSILIESFMLGNSNEESKLKAKLLCEVLDVPEGTRPGQLFLARGTELSELFNRFQRTDEPNLKSTYGFRILEIIRKTRRPLIQQLHVDLGDTILEFLRRVETYVVSERAKLIHDTSLELRLVSERAVHQHKETRITLEVLNLGEGMADSLKLTILPVQGQYEVESWRQTYSLKDISDKTPQQIDIFIRPLVESNKSLELEAELCYSTLKSKEKSTTLDKLNQTVWLYPETQFLHVKQAFSYSQPATTWFYGRQDVLQSMVDHHQETATIGVTPMIIYGLKRAGKTSVVKRFIDTAMKESGIEGNYASLYIDISTHVERDERLTDGDFLYSLVRNIVEKLEDQGYYGVVSQEIYDSRAAFREKPFDTFSRLLNQILESLHPRRLLLALDEFSSLNEYLADNRSHQGLTSELFTFLSNTVQRTARLTFIFTGTYILLEMMREHAYDLAKISVPRLISFIDDASARKLVTEPVARRHNQPDHGWLDYDSRVVDRIVSVTNRHPYLIQYLCLLLVERMNILKYNTVNLSDINAIIDEFITKPAYSMALLVFWDDFDQLKQKVLSVIATSSSNIQDGVGVQEITEIFASFRDQTTAEDILKACNSLSDAEMLEKTSLGEKDVYTIKLPIYQMWLKENKSPATVFSE